MGNKKKLNVVLIALVVLGAVSLIFYIINGLFSSGIVQLSALIHLIVTLYVFLIFNLLRNPKYRYYRLIYGFILLFLYVAVMAMNYLYVSWHHRLWIMVLSTGLLWGISLYLMFSFRKSFVQQKAEERNIKEEESVEDETR